MGKSKPFTACKQARKSSGLKPVHLVGGVAAILAAVLLLRGGGGSSNTGGRGAAASSSKKNPSHLRAIKWKPEPDDPGYRTVRLLENGAQVAAHQAPAVWQKVTCDPWTPPALPAGWTAQKLYTSVGKRVWSCGDFEDRATLYRVELGQHTLEHFVWPQP